MTRLLVTGFGPFPGAKKNPTETLVAGLADQSAQTLGASVLKAAVLPTDYRRSWQMLRRLYAGFRPDIVVHFGVSLRAEAIHVERVARNAANPARPDAAGYVPPSRRARRGGPDLLHATLPISAIVEALSGAGFAALHSDDAGAYVCNATLYRSLHAAPPTRRVGFVHVPPQARNRIDGRRLREAATIILRVAATANETAHPGPLRGSTDLRPTPQ